MQLLFYDKHHEVTQQTPVSAIVSSMLASDDDVKNLGFAFDGDHAIALLVSLFDDKSSTTVRELTRVTERLGESIPFVVARLNNQADSNGSALLAPFVTLEHLSRAPADQSYFLQHSGVKRLAKLLKVSSNVAVKITVARIFANISYQNLYVSELIVAFGVAQELISMIKSTDVKLETAALMALRNLTNNDNNRHRIGSSAVIVQLIQIVTAGKSLKQKETAVAVLGNLAHIQVTQENIRYNGGVAAVLAFIPETTTLQQLETAAGALWVLTDAVEDSDVKGGVAIIQKAMEPHEPHQVPWTTRLLLRLNNSNSSQ